MSPPWRDLIGVSHYPLRVKRMVVIEILSVNSVWARDLVFIARISIDSMIFVNTR